MIQETLEYLCCSRFLVVVRNQFQLRGKPSRTILVHDFDVVEKSWKWLFLTIFNGSTKKQDSKGNSSITYCTHTNTHTHSSRCGNRYMVPGNASLIKQSCIADCIFSPKFHSCYSSTYLLKHEVSNWSWTGFRPISQRHEGDSLLSWSGRRCIFQVTLQRIEAQTSYITSNKKSFSSNKRDLNDRSIELMETQAKSITDSFKDLAEALFEKELDLRTQSTLKSCW